MNNRILLVEDERELAMIIADTLRDQGFEVRIARNGAEGLESFMANRPDAIVADVMMPKMDGFTLAEKIRRLSTTIPILFLTAKSSIEDIERGFDTGANDYLRKPFELRELLIRIKALLRNVNRSTTHTIGEYTFNATDQTLCFGDKVTRLSHFESRILELLINNRGRMLTSTELMLAIWGRDDLSSLNSLHGYIHKLRRHLRSDPAITLINHRGFGYSLT